MEVCRRYRKGEAGLAWRVEERGGDLEEKPAAFPFPDLGGGCPEVAFQLFSNLG